LTAQSGSPELLLVPPPVGRHSELDPAVYPLLLAEAPLLVPVTMPPLLVVLPPTPLLLLVLPP
jgi:hypothetical protein